MKHEAFRELLALDLYGELDSAGAAALAAHLDACDACRAFRAELAAGLGRTVAAGSRERALPHDWDRRLRERAGTAQPRRSRFWIAAAASFVAGALLTWALVRNASPETGAPHAQGAALNVAFARAAPPVPARITGQLARLLEGRRR